MIPVSADHLERMAFANPGSVISLGGRVPSLTIAGVTYGAVDPCPHTLSPGGLVCDRTDAHDPDARGNHTYTASGGAMDAEGGDGS